MSKTNGGWPHGRSIAYQGQPFVTAAAPGCICNDGTLRLFWPDQTSHVIQYSDLQDGGTNSWSQPLATNPALTTTLQPNIAAPSGLDTIVFNSGGQIRFSQMPESTSTPPWPPAEALPTPPAAPTTAPAIYANFAAMQTYCAWGTSNEDSNLIYYSLDAGQWWQPPVPAGAAATGGTPAMVEFNGALYLIAPSPDAPYRLYASTYANGQWSAQTPITPAGQGTTGGVTACANADGIWVFWQSYPDRLISYTMWNGATWSPPDSINGFDTTLDTPGCATDGEGTIYVTWKANDATNGLWWSACKP
jgi:hypothetical protein